MSHHEAMVVPDDEVSLLSSIYSAEDESVFLTSSNFLHVQLSPSIKIHLEIPVGYPESRAPILQSLEGGGTDCSLNKSGMDLIQEVFTPGIPCLYSIIEALKELILSSVEKKEQKTLPSSSPPREEFILIELDHMRNEKRYVKALQLWTNELGLLTRLLVIEKRIILLLLLGESSSLKEFVSRLRNRNVDMDSRGRPCKERMAKILCCLNAESRNCVFESSIWNNNLSFQVIKEEDSSVQDFLARYNLGDLYEKYMI